MKRVSPLEQIGNRLTFGPPSIADILAFLDGGDYHQEFWRLIHEYLPDKMQVIWRGNIETRINKFCAFFAERYFPLADPEQYEFELSRFVGSLPIDLFGVSADRYEDLDFWEDGEMLMMALCQVPVGHWTGDPDNGSKFVPDNTLKIPLFDKLREWLPDGLIASIPEAGWEAETLYNLCSGTKYQGLADFASWIEQNTGTIQLDANWDEYGESAWEPHLVEQLTHQWPIVQEMRHNIAEFGHWLIMDPKKNFADTLAYLRQTLVPKEQLLLPLIFEGGELAKGET